MESASRSQSDATARRETQADNSYSKCFSVFTSLAPCRCMWSRKSWRREFPYSTIARRHTVNIIAIFIGGGSGAVSRFLLSRYISSRQITGMLPLGTLAENSIGSFLIGFFFQLIGETALPTYLRSFITVGFLGGFTTFSTYALETVLLLEKRQYAAAAVNFVSHNLLGFLAVVAGMFLCDKILAQWHIG